MFIKIPLLFSNTPNGMHELMFWGSGFCYLIYTWWLLTVSHDKRLDPESLTQESCDWTSGPIPFEGLIARGDSLFPKGRSTIDRHAFISNLVALPGKFDSTVHAGGEGAQITTWQIDKKYPYPFVYVIQLVFSATMDRNKSSNCWPERAR